MDKDFNYILKESESNNDILSLILVGSRGKGFENEHSDYDAIMIVKEDFLEELKREFEDKNFDNLDLCVLSLQEFKTYADIGSPMEWARYDFAHTKILVDKTSNLKKLVEAKGFISKSKQKEFIEGYLDGYINGVYRSVKCIRNKNQLGAQIEASNSMLDLLTLVFAFEGRHKPFYGYTEKELKAHPLKLLPWAVSEFVSKNESRYT